MKGDIDTVAMIFAIVILTIFCAGDPDLIDALIIHFSK